MNPLISNEDREKAEKRYAELIRKIRKYTVADTSLLKEAFRTAMKQHERSWRKGGAPYITHPLEVAHFCADMKMDNEVIAAALLHDVVEDENITLSEIFDKFGPKVAQLVEAVTDLDASLEEYEAMGKRDLDVLSDVKLVEHISHTPQSLYVKVADRVHNLSDIKCMPYEKSVAKVQHTKDILIPLLRTIRATRLIEILEDLCFEAENVRAYRQIVKGYRKLLDTNRLSTLWLEDFVLSVFFGYTNKYYIQEGVVPAPGSELPDPEWIRTLVFVRRFNSSIYKDIQDGMDNIFAELPFSLTKKNVALYDIYFVTDNECPLTPADFFFAYYPILHAGVYLPENDGFKDVRFMLTIVGEGKDKVTGLPYYLMRDIYGNGCRIFMQKADEYSDFMNGSIHDADEAKMPEVKVIDTAEPSNAFSETIHVYLRDGKVKEMPAGSTILDLAFKIHPYVGLCAKYAYLNGRNVAIPLYTKLTDGDQVDIQTDSDKNNPENNIIHATIRWFEHVRTREATRQLSRYFEKHLEAGRTSTRIFLGDSEAKEVPTGCTVLDLAFILGREKGLHFSRAYINKSQRPCSMDYVLAYDDKVRIESDENVQPRLGWLKIVRIPEVRRTLVEYFEERYE